MRFVFGNIFFGIPKNFGTLGTREREQAEQRSSFRTMAALRSAPIQWGKTAAGRTYRDVSEVRLNGTSHREDFTGTVGRSPGSGREFGLEDSALPEAQHWQPSSSGLEGAAGGRNTVATITPNAILCFALARTVWRLWPPASAKDGARAVVEGEGASPSGEDRSSQKKAERGASDRWRCGGLATLGGRFRLQPPAARRHPPRRNRATGAVGARGTSAARLKDRGREDREERRGRRGGEELLALATAPFSSSRWGRGAPCWVEGIFVRGAAERLRLRQLRLQPWPVAPSSFGSGSLLPPGAAHIQ